MNRGIRFWRRRAHDRGGGGPPLVERRRGLGSDLENFSGRKVGWVGGKHVEASAKGVK